MRDIPIGSVWRSTVNPNTTYTVESVFDGYVTISSKTGHRYVRSIPQFWKIMLSIKSDGPVKPQLGKWEDVEAALRAYNEAKREDDRLRARVEDLASKLYAARGVVDDHKIVLSKAAAAYSRELNKMEALVK